MIVTPSLIDAFEFNGNANGIRGTVGTVSGATLVNCNFGQAYNFQNATDYLTYQYNQNYDVSEMTICFWCNIENINKIISFLVHRGSNGWSGWAVLYYNGLIIDFGGGNLRWTTGFLFSVNKWTHISITKSTINNQRKLYVDGKLHSQINIQSPVSTYSRPLLVSRDLYGESTGNYYNLNGQMTKIKLFNKTLSDTDIKRIYEGFSPLNG